VKGEGSVFHDEAGRERAAPVYSLMREDSAIFAPMMEQVDIRRLKRLGRLAVQVQVLLGASFDTLKARSPLS